ncbi:MAG: Ig-like domain-containing protein [Clostridia bacterium]|nr:Ig-like domain-containing protein [Clostridia bacterium]
MKKTVILILILLPIVLLITIAFAGRILSTYQHIAVERVVFVDDAGADLAGDTVLVLGMGETKPTFIKIYPELSADKRVSYSSSDEAVCTVDSTGAVTGVGAGSAVIIVRTADGNKTAMLSVSVKADQVTGVTLLPEALQMMIGERSDLQVIVEPYAALNKHVTYTTSDPDVVTVSAIGKLTAVGAGTATVTVTTKDGGFTDTCVVTVTDDTPPLFFDLSGVEGMQQTGTGYISAVSTVDLAVCLKVDQEKIATEDIRFRILSGDGATLDDSGVLSFTQSDIVVVEVYVGDANNPTYRAEIRIAWIG